MLFFLRKLIEALLLPIGISGILIVAGIGFRRRWIVVAGAIVLYTFSTPITGGRLMQSLERAYQPRTVSASPHADAIVVLSGGVVRGVTAPGVQWGDSSNRYFAGFDLFQAGKAQEIVFSAAATQDPSGPSQGAILRQTAIDHGISSERIILTPRVQTTEDEARAVSEVPNVHSILLVTSAFHMPRAVLLFEAQGLNVSPFPTDERAWGRLVLAPSAFIPVSAALQSSELAMREYYGLAVYRLILFFRPGHKSAALQVPPQRALAE
jgi:uncharacterized SAM-binding protein YcdF (DUF218 family)